MSNKEEAHAELRRRGCTDDVHATNDACLVIVFFYLLGLVTVVSAYV